MEHKKISFVIIIILLVIFVPLAVYTTTMRIINKDVIAENNATDNLEFKHDGKLYFYDKNDTLLGTYTCKHFDDYCDYAVNKATYEYDFLEYKPSNKEKLEKLEKQYVFLMDTTIDKLTSADIILYDVVNETEVLRLVEVKKTEFGYIAKDESGLWGVIDFSGPEFILIPFNYNYIGISNTNSLTNSYYAVLEENSWNIIDSNNTKLTTNPLTNIFSYSDKYIATKSADVMHLIDYDGTKVLEDDYKYLDFYDKYIVIVDTKDIFYLYDLEKKEKVSREFLVTDPNEISFETEGTSIKIFIGNDLSETIAIG